MHQLYPDEGLIAWLYRMTTDDLHFHLFMNDLTPDLDTVLTDLVEATFTGYLVQTVATSDWNTGAIIAHVASILAPAIHFVNSSGSDQSAYGYFITNAADDTLLAVARFDSAPVIKHNTEAFDVVPILSDFSKYSS